MEGFLASRAAAALQPALTYFPAFFKAQEHLWTPEDQGGYISMVVAENRVSTDLVQAGLNAHAADTPARMLHYQDARGIAELRSTLADVAQHTFMQGVDVDPEHLTVLTGCGSVIDLLLHLVADAGDAVLIPAPYYPAFDNDLQARNRVQPVPAYLDMAQQDLSAGLDAAAAAAQQTGKRVAALLFTHPSNPQGLLYSRQQLRSMISWCLKHKVHCIGDEVYALSVFDPSASLVSTAQVLAQDRDLLEAPELADDLVHIVFGASKDFCGSGLRLGVLYTKNPHLNTALGNLSYFCSVPGPLQMTLARLLSDRAWLDGFLVENRRRLRAAYSTLTGALDQAGIPYTPAPAGMFLWVDMRAAFGGPDAANAIGHSDGSGSCLPAAASWQDEAELWQHMVDVQRLVLTPGEACHAAEPGFFRMCYAWPHPASIPVAVQRMSAAIKHFRTQAQQDVRQQHRQALDQQRKQAQQQQQQDSATAAAPADKLAGSGSSGIDVHAVSV